MKGSSFQMGGSMASTSDTISLIGAISSRYRKRQLM